MRRRRGGFTIVELLIVIVVIAILAAITIVAYNGVQERARQASMQSAVANLKKAAIVAENITGKPLGIILGGYAPQCGYKVAGDNLATYVGTTDTCWTQYVTWLQNLSAASNMDLNPNSLLDPYGRPYFIDPNEAENNTMCASKDTIAAYPLPFQNRPWDSPYPGTYTRAMPLSGNAAGYNGC